MRYDTGSREQTAADTSSRGDGPRRRRLLRKGRCDSCTILIMGRKHFETMEMAHTFHTHLPSHLPSLSHCSKKSVS